jgi:hypothetical protein
MPNGSTITSSHTALLQLPGLPDTARRCHIFPQLASGSLLSIGLLCDHDCTVTFHKTHVDVYLVDTLLLTGHRSPRNGLWTIDLPTTLEPSINSVATPITRTIADRIAFYHASLFSPALSTWCRTIDAGHLTTWPELTSKQVRAYPPTSIAMLKGHLDQTRANSNSTKRHPPSILEPSNYPAAAAASAISFPSYHRRRHRYIPQRSHCFRRHHRLPSCARLHHPSRPTYPFHFRSHPRNHRPNLHRPTWALPSRLLLWQLLHTHPLRL